MISLWILVCSFLGLWIFTDFNIDPETIFKKIAKDYGVQFWYVLSKTFYCGKKNGNPLKLPFGKGVYVDLVEQKFGQLSFNIYGFSIVLFTHHDSLKALLLGVYICQQLKLMSARPLRFEK